MLAVFSRPLVLRSVRWLATQPQPPPPPQQQSSALTEKTPPQTSSTKLTVPSLDFAGSKTEPEMERTGARSSKDTLSNADRRRRMWGRAFFGLMGLGIGAFTMYMGREWTEEEMKQKKWRIEDAPTTWSGRTKERFTEIFDYFNKPVWSELLPPPLPPPQHKPYTLLLSIDDLLVTSTWDRQHGWRTAKRPGVDYFLAYLSQFYEVVIFTTQYHYTAIPILEKLDRYNFFINYRLFREATRSVNGKIVKDLSYLNRDLSKVILLDTVPDHVSTHPENAIIIPKWKGDTDDKGLVAMIPFLESIGIYKPPDVRPILEAYRDKNIPLEYARKEAEAKQRHLEEWKSGKKSLGVGGFTLSRLFGHNPSNMSSIPLTYLEQKRKEAQQQYREEQAYIESHKDEFERLLDQEQRAMAKEAPNNLWDAFRAMNGMKPSSSGPESEKKSEEGGSSSSASPMP